MTSPRVRSGHRSGPATVRALALALVLVAGASTLAAAPAAADKPPGSQAELIFAADPDYGTPVTEGTFGSNLFVLPTGGRIPPAPRLNGCTSGQRVGFAFTAASADPGTGGSAERPAVTAGQSIEDLFEWPTAGYLGDRVVLSMNPLNRVGKADDQQLLDERWPAGTRVSVVAVCFEGRGDERSEQTVVAGPDGFAVTSWLQFTTVASPTDPAKTSAGFATGVVRATPVVALSGSQAGTTTTLTASLRGADGAALTDASGRIDFYVGVGADRALAGTAPVGVAGDAILSVTVPLPGEVSVYDAVYVPDVGGATRYRGATSRRYAVVGPELQVPADMMLTAPDSPYGESLSATVTVRRGTAPASGPVVLALDGRSLPTVALAGGRATVRLPALLGAGAHTIAASYAGDDSTGPAQAITTVTVGRLTSALSVERVAPPTKPGGSERTSKRRLKKVALRARVTCSSTAVDPPGALEVRLNGKLLSTSSLATAVDGVVTLVVKIPKDKGHKSDKGDERKSRKAVLVVSYTGTADIEAAADQLVTVKLKRSKKAGDK